MDHRPKKALPCALLLTALAALACLATARADIVLLDEYWTPEIVQHNTAVSEIDTQETDDPAQAKTGEVSALLENATGWPSVRFRGAATVILGEIPPEDSEVSLWYRTDAWEGRWSLQIWTHHHTVADTPLIVLGTLLDGGGEDGKMIADDEWHRATGRLLERDAYRRMPHDEPLATYVWLRPVDGWDLPHRTFIDRLEVDVVAGPMADNPAPEPAGRVRPDPGAQTTGGGWIWWEGEDAVEHSFVPTGFFMPDNADQQEALSNGFWLEHSSGTPAEGMRATWEVELAEPGRYDFWCRGGWLAAPFRWRWDDGEWHGAGMEMERVDPVVMRDWITASWVRLGQVELEAGRHALQIEGLPGARAFGFDCFLLTREPFAPDGHGKPGAKTGAESGG